jgi:hypothetical protein
MNPLRMRMEAQALEEEDRNEAHRALHRHPRRIGDGIRRSDRYLGAPQRKNLITFLNNRVINE